MFNIYLDSKFAFVTVPSRIKADRRTCFNYVQCIRIVASCSILRGVAAISVVTQVARQFV